MPEEKKGALPTWLQELKAKRIPLTEAEKQDLVTKALVEEALRNQNGCGE